MCHPVFQKDIITVSPKNNQLIRKTKPHTLCKSSIRTPYINMYQIKRICRRIHMYWKWQLPLFSQRTLITLKHDQIYSAKYQNLISKNYKHLNKLFLEYNEKSELKFAQGKTQLKFVELLNCLVKAFLKSAGICALKYLCMMQSPLVTLAWPIIV